jgi:hypothetical protein
LLFRPQHSVLILREEFAVVDELLVRIDHGPHVAVFKVNSIGYIDSHHLIAHVTLYQGCFEQLFGDVALLVIISGPSIGDEGAARPVLNVRSIFNEFIQLFFGKVR